MILGRVAFGRERWAEARDHYAQAAEDEPAGPSQSRVPLALSHHLLEEYDEALAELGREIAARPGDGRLYFLRGQVNHDKGDAAAARLDYEAGLRCPNNPVLARTHLDLGMMKHEAKDHAGAVAEFDAALRARKVYPLAHLARAHALLALSRDAEAGRALDEYLKRARPDAATLRARAVIHATRGQHGDAARRYTEALSLGDDIELLNLRGWAYLQSGALALAEADFDAVLEDEPEYTDALSGRALVRARQGKARPAVADAEAAILSREPTPTLMLQAACVYALAARREEPPRRGPSPYEDRAAKLVAKAVGLEPADRRAKFWRERVEKEEALRGVLRLPEMARLRREVTR